MPEHDTNLKPPFGEKIDAKTYQQTISILENNLKILHPFMPFITEEIWQFIDERTPQDAMIVTAYPELLEFDNAYINAVSQVKEVISNIRKIRKEKNIPQKESIVLSVIENEKLPLDTLSLITKMGNVSEINIVLEPVDNAGSFRVKFNEYFVPLEGLVDEAAEKEKLEEELAYTEGFLKGVQKKLSNERFVNNAPEKVVAMEKKKEADALEKIELLKKRLNR